MSLLYLNACRLRLPNIVSLGACLKKLHLVKVGALDTASRFALFSGSSLQDKKLIKSEPTLCPKKTCDYIFYNNFNNKCPITIIFGIVSSKSMCHRKMVSFPTSPI